MTHMREPRRRVLKGGKIIFNDATSVIDCVVRNLSDGGAALEVATPLGIPGEFRLAVLNEFERPCRVAWIRGGRLGVKFL